MAIETNTVQRIALKALIVNDAGDVLILREAKTYDEGTQTGRYHIPGGRLNIGEPIIDGLNREVLEETGLTVNIVKPIYIGEWFPVIKQIPNQIVAIYYICRTTRDSSVILSEEHDKYEWIDPHKHINYDIMDPEHEVITEYLQSLGIEK